MPIPSWPPPCGSSEVEQADGKRVQGASGMRAEVRGMWMREKCMAVRAYGGLGRRFKEERKKST